METLKLKRSSSRPKNNKSKHNKKKDTYMLL